MKLKFENPFGRKNKDEKGHTKKAGANTARMFAAALAAMSPQATTAGATAEHSGQTKIEEMFNNPETIPTDEGIAFIQMISQMTFPEIKTPSSKKDAALNFTLEEQKAAALNLALKERVAQDYIALVKKYIQAHPADGAYDPARELQHIAMLAKVKVGSKEIHIRWANPPFHSYVIMDLQERLPKVTE